VCIQVRPHSRESSRHVQLSAVEGLSPRPRHHRPSAFDDIAEQLAVNDDNNDQTSEEILLSAITGLPEDKLIEFAPRLVLTPHIPIPREDEFDFLAEAENAFATPQPKKTGSKKTKTATPIKAAAKTSAKQTTAKKQAAA
jgi:ParB family chromosome partitioning protein